MSGLDCAELDELAAELALGVLPGDERAAALAHLEGCRDCQARVEELSDAADTLLSLAPEAEPPAGFASRVTGAMKASRPRRHQRVAALAAVVTLVLGGGTALGAMLPHLGARSTPAPFALRAPGVRMAAFVPVPSEHVAGQVFAYAGSPSWVFMTVHENDSTDTYTCELELSNGTRLRIGTFQLHDGVGDWGRTVGLDVTQIKSVLLIKASGATAATGVFV